MQNSKRWSLLVVVALLVVATGSGVASAVVADSPVTPLSPSQMMVVCVEQSSSRLFQAVANRCDAASQFKLVWPVRGAAPQVCVNTLSREMTLSSSGKCRTNAAFLARATTKRPFLGCADKDTGMLRWPRTGVCWWQNTSMVLMSAAETSTTTTSSSTTTTSTSSTTTTSTTTTSVPSVVAPVLVSVSASDGVQITVAGMRPDTGVYSLQWVPYGQSFNTYQMARATSPSMSVPAGWFACNRTYTFRVFVMQADWQLADGHQTQNVTPHSTPFDVVMPACPAPATTPAPATAPVAPLTCATGGACVVGDTGPGGGIVFYVSLTNFTSTGSDCDTTCKYLEAAPAAAEVRLTWATNANSNQATAVQAPGATAQGIGSGMANTNAIQAQLGNVAATSAAVYAYEYTNSGKGDWHLPSMDELNQLCRYAWNLTISNTTTTCTGMSGSIRTGFTVLGNWSSSENNATTARGQVFLDGAHFDSGGLKSNTHAVRPVRAFGGTVACADGGACVVGDTGPGGGKVFYVSATNFTSTGSDCGTTCKYLESATSDQSTGTITWCSNTTSSLSASARAIGTGMANTTRADTTCTSGAIQIAADFANNGKIDWHLPSRDELAQLYSQKTTVGGFSLFNYWSSTETASNAVWAVRFDNGSGFGQFKHRTYSVRPVRAFG